MSTFALGFAAQLRELCGEGSHGGNEVEEELIKLIKNEVYSAEALKKDKEVRPRQILCLRLSGLQVA
jgi:hypothetical protein